MGVCVIECASLCYEASLDEYMHVQLNPIFNTNRQAESSARDEREVRPIAFYA